MFVCAIWSTAVEAPILVATSALPSQAISRPPALTHATNAFLPLAPSAWRA